ncbi:MAG: hypothetical protein ACJAZM_002317 [Cyclobacteriaceae bacterium]|jgi:hypothetical protein
MEILQAIDIEESLLGAPANVNSETLELFRNATQLHIKSFVMGPDPPSSERIISCTVGDPASCEYEPHLMRNF